jgi:dTDP-glucose pyrophosphorylase
MRLKSKDMANRTWKISINPKLSISDAITILDKSGLGVLLVCEEDQKLQGVITDGDIRRALIKGIPLSDPCGTIANPDPVVAPDSVTNEDALGFMDHAKEFFVNHLPLLDKQGKVVGLLLRSDFTQKVKLGFSAVVMAGGFGTRLRPLTEDLPKPMLPVGDKPLLETVICQLRDVGVKQVSVTTHYRSEKIREHFGDGKRFGVDISYVNEEQPLGTAGALGLMKLPNEPLLVINGDILTKLNFKAMFEFHKEHEAAITLAVIRQKMQVLYGIIECSDVRVTALKEKPEFYYLINAGIYLLEPSVFTLIPNGTTFHMTDLIQLLLDKGRKIVSFPIHEYWLDIGHLSDYEKANGDYALTFGGDV